MVERGRNKEEGRCVMDRQGTAQKEAWWRKREGDGERAGKGRVVDEKWRASNTRINEIKLFERLEVREMEWRRVVEARRRTGGGVKVREHEGGGREEK